MSDIGWGILGTGGIAHTFAKDLIDDGHIVAAVGSRSQGSADAFADEFGIPVAHGSYDDLVADDDVDVVYIATPHPAHADNAELALNAGKHVLIEKPFTLNAAEAQRVVDLAGDRDLVVMEAMWTRFLPHVERIRDLVNRGILGEVREFAADHMQLLSSDPGHRINALELGGGALLDLGIYPVSFASMLFGTPEQVEASARFGATGADAATAAVFRYGDAALAAVRCALDLRGTNTATITGTRARIEIDSVWYAPTNFRVVAHEGHLMEEYKSRVFGRGMQFQAREIERLIEEGLTASDIMPPEESVSIMRTLDDIRARIGLVYPQER
ncbi:Gfo/Idh/MocA family protein [Humibacter ginsenosidimutans]|uniref:Gfo/Idh/MocA family oxidoreductase n=1 Tax=Humibacter ginsenosidimutans TaxID=2599293 RepID=A0A5B8M7G1_9MICO|nr:Gfo/Idh/MocA family oxidoreductase [Humibacter ginsenosidimutans]QDZ16363.1 Gfo/Idh/MocA family oxidoreductase [Humibacter ginsenosidimutans]